MKRKALMFASTAAIAFSILHLADDITRGFERGAVGNFLTAIPMYTIILYAAAFLSHRRRGYVIVLLGSLIGLLIPMVHMLGEGLARSIGHTDGALFFIAVTLAVGVASLFCVTLCIEGLIVLRQRPPALDRQQGSM